jgi:hypothetical protein
MRAPHASPLRTRDAISFDISILLTRKFAGKNRSRPLRDQTSLCELDAYLFLSSRDCEQSCPFYEFPFSRVMLEVKEPKKRWLPSNLASAEHR